MSWCAPYKRRADQRIHAGRNAHVLHGALALELRHLGHEHAGLRHEETAGLEPELEPRPAAAQLVDDALQRREIDGRLARLFRHAQTHRQDVDARAGEALGKAAEQLPDFLPVADVEYAAAGVGMKAHDARPERRDPALELVELEERHAELRMHAGGAHVVVVTAPVAGIDAHQQVAPAEQFAPVTQRMQVVERHPRSALERPLVLVAGRKVGRKQDLLPIDGGDGLEHPLDFAARHALEPEALLGKARRISGCGFALIA